MEVRMAQQVTVKFVDDLDGHGRFKIDKMG
jgi:hypothetical protein